MNKGYSCSLGIGSLRRIEHAITPETNISRKEKRRGGVRAKRKGKNKRGKP
jgi:hypothetical protein